MIKSIKLVLTVACIACEAIANSLEPANLVKVRGKDVGTQSDFNHTIVKKEEVPFSSKTDIEQKRQFDSYRRQRPGSSLALDVSRFAVEQGVSANMVRNCLGAIPEAMTEEEQKEYQKGSKYKSELRKKKRKEEYEARKKKQKEEYENLIAGASADQISEAIGDEGQAEYFAELRKKKLAGENLTDKEQSFLDKNTKKVGRKLYSEKKRAEREARRRESNVPSEAAKAAFADWGKKSTEEREQERQAEIAARKERAKEALDLMDSKEDKSRRSTKRMPRRSRSSADAFRISY